MRRPTLLLLALALLAPALPAQEQRREEKVDYYKKWLDEDVAYIISEEERETFEKLTTPEEKDAFIEQFWSRRDPDPRTAANEFKEEHYRRIAYANERFHSGVPGWRTDRGRIYIKYGEPDEISGKPVGGMHVRSPYEGGGATSVYPFVVWRYNYIEGIGNDVEIEFVDPHQSGEFRIARDPLEKDAMLYIPNAGSTLSEAAGLTDKRDRIVTRSLANQELRKGNPFYVTRLKDQPFEQMLLRAKLDQPPEVRFKDLEAIVHSDVYYERIPHQVKVNYLRVSDDNVLAPLTLIIPNRELGYQPLESGVHRATVQVYGEVWDLGKKLVYNFEDELTVDLPPERREQALQRDSIFQRHLPVKAGRQRVRLVIKDVHSNKVATADKPLIVPRFPEDGLSSSSVILADAIVPEKDGEEPGMFSLGGLKVIPSADGAYSLDEHVFVYFQVYGAASDQQTQLPAIRLSRFRDGGKKVNGGRPALVVGGDGRLIITDVIPAKELGAGTHRLRYRVEDLVQQTDIDIAADVRIEKSGALSGVGR